MSTRHWLIAISTGFALTGLAAGGCGGTTTESTPDAGGPDSTSDVTPDRTTTDTGSSDTGVVEEPAVCTVDASLATAAPPDAGLAGDASVGTCINCARGTCGSQVTACDADCQCKEDLFNFITCVAAGTSYQTCAAAIIAGGDQPALLLGECMLNSCTAACGLGGGPKDAGNDGPSEAEPLEAGEQ